MHCPTCDRAMMSTSSQVFEDEKGAMTITRWHCRPCHETAEEIWLSAGLHLASCSHCSTYVKQINLVSYVLTRFPKLYPSPVNRLRLRRQFVAQNGLPL